MVFVKDGTIILFTVMDMEKGNRRGVRCSFCNKDNGLFNSIFLF